MNLYATIGKITIVVCSLALIICPIILHFAWLTEETVKGLLMVLFGFAIHAVIFLTIANITDKK